MNANPLVVFVQTHVEMFLRPGNNSVVLPLSEELARHFLIGLKTELRGKSDFIIRAKKENLPMLKNWIYQNGLEAWINIDNDVFRLNEKALQDDEKAQIIDSLERLFPRHLHSTPGKLAMFFMKLRNRLSSAQFKKIKLL